MTSLINRLLTMGKGDEVKNNILIKIIIYL